MLFTFLLVVQAIIAAALVTVILMQQSEGGGLGTGGSPSGLMSARGAADFLTRATSALATVFVGLSIVLAIIAATQHRSAAIDTSLVQDAAPISSAAPAADPVNPLGGAPANGASSAAKSGNEAVPLAQ